MSDTTRVTQEWGVRYGDGLIVECADREEAEGEVERAPRFAARGNAEYEGAEVIVRTTTATVTDWETPNE